MQSFLAFTLGIFLGNTGFKFPMPKLQAKIIWKDVFYIKAYQLAKVGLTDKDIARTFGVTTGKLKKWIRERSALRYALGEGRKQDAKAQEEYIYGKLSGPARKIWDQIKQVKGQYSGEAVARLIDSGGEQTRKILFFHVLTKSHFNPTQACRKLGISYTTYRKWMEEDYQFAMTIQEMAWHKGNYYEEALDRLIRIDKDPQAIIFANKSFNKSRGYSEKLEIEHKGNVTHSHLIELSDALLERLSKPAKLEILEVLDQIEVEQKKLGNTVDAGSTKNGD